MSRAAVNKKVDSARNLRKEFRIMARHANADWILPERVTQSEHVTWALLMDIRDELKRLNSVLHCSSFLDIPHKLDVIKRNTTKKPRAKKPKLKAA